MLLLHITLGAVEPSCIMCVRYIRGGGGGGKEGVFSTFAGSHEYIGGYHEYIGICSKHQRVTMMQVGGYYDPCGSIMSTLGDVQYIEVSV